MQDISWWNSTPTVFDVLNSTIFVICYENIKFNFKKWIPEQKFSWGMSNQGWLYCCIIAILLYIKFFFQFLIWKHLNDFKRRLFNLGVNISLNSWAFVVCCESERVMTGPKWGRNYKLNVFEVHVPSNICIIQSAKALILEYIVMQTEAINDDRF